MVEASKNVVCVLVDCEWGARHADLAQKYRIQGFPTVVFADSDGVEVGRMSDRGADSVAGDLLALARDHASRSR